MKLENKNIIITGAGQGIGKELALILGKKNNIILIGRDYVKLKLVKNELNTKNHLVVQCDISKSFEIAKAYSIINSQFNKIDIVINNAGISSAKKFDQYSEDEINNILDVNVKGTILFTHKFINLLKDSKGTLINIGSMFGDIAHPYYSIYSSSKFAIRGFSDAIRREYSHHGVKVFYVSPRATQTKSLAVTNNIGKHFKMNIDEPYIVANLIINNVEKNNFYIYPKTIERTFLFVQKLFPRLIDNNLSKIAKKIHYN